MNRYALQHIPDSAYCFPVSEHEMGLRLRTAKNDLTQVWVIYESTYRFGRENCSTIIRCGLTCRIPDYLIFFICSTEKIIIIFQRTE